MAQVSDVFKDYIKIAEQGKTITPEALKRVSALTLFTFKKYQDQSERYIAFYMMAEKMLSKLIFDELKAQADNLVALGKAVESQEGKPNG